ncbi:MAG: hypothetical protein ACR2PT_12565 [Endozoicomonas sp.]
MLEILYLVAITVEAMAGAVAAGRKKMDPIFLTTGKRFLHQEQET